MRKRIHTSQKSLVTYAGLLLALSAAGISHAGGEVRVSCTCTCSSNTVLVHLTYTNMGSDKVVIDGSGLIGPMVMAEGASRGEDVSAYTNVWIPVGELKEGLVTLSPGNSMVISYDLTQGQKLFHHRAPRRYVVGEVPTALGLLRFVTNVTSVSRVRVYFRKKSSRDDIIRRHFGRPTSELVGADVYGWDTTWSTNVPCLAASTVDPPK